MRQRAGTYDLTKASAFDVDGGATNYFKPYSSLVLIRLTVTTWLSKNTLVSKSVFMDRVCLNCSTDFTQANSLLSDF
ncbi:hypothetical protein GCM10027347_55450 [Larkinella harenae]